MLGVTADEVPDTVTIPKKTAKYLDKFCNSLEQTLRHANDTSHPQLRKQRLKHAFRSLHRGLEHKALSRGPTRLYTPRDTTLYHLAKGNNTKSARMEESAVVTPDREALGAKYPLQCASREEVLEIPFPQGGEHHYEFTVEEALEYIDTRSNLSSKGADGSDLLLVKRLLERPKGAVVLQVYHEAVKADALDWDTWLEATELRNVNLSKPNGSFRPLGIAKPLERIRQGIVAMRSKSSLNSIVLDPDDMTLRSRATSVIAVTAMVLTQVYNFDIIAMDQRNAFNEVNMAEVATILRAHELDQTASVVESLQVHRVNTPHGVLLARNIPQGSSLGSAAMAVKMSACLGDSRKTLEGNALVLTLADDVTVIAPNREVTAAADLVASALRDGHLHENKDKRATWTPRVGEAAIKVVGSFIGTNEQVKDAVTPLIDDEIRQVTEFADRVASYALHATDPVRQTALRALRLNFIPRLVHVQQNHPVTTTQEALKRYDEAVRNAALKILSIHEEEKSDEIFEQLSLPTNSGGFGLTPLAETAFLQRLGTLAATIETVIAKCSRIVRIRHGEPFLLELPDLIDFAIKELDLEPDHPLSRDLLNLRRWNQQEYNPSPEEKHSIKSIQSRAMELYRQKRLAAWKRRFTDEDALTRELVESICSKEAGRVLNVTTSFVPNQVSDRAFLLFASDSRSSPRAKNSSAKCALETLTTSLSTRSRVIRWDMAAFINQLSRPFIKYAQISRSTPEIKSSPSNRFARATCVTSRRI